MTCASWAACHSVASRSARANCRASRPALAREPAMTTATPTHTTEPTTPIPASAPGPAQTTVCAARKPTPAQATTCCRRTAQIVISVPTAATYQVAYPLSFAGSSWLVTRIGITTQTARSNAASHSGILVGLVGHRLATVAIPYRTMATITGPAALGVDSDDSARNTWYAENSAPRLRKRTRLRVITRRPPRPAGTPRRTHRGRTRRGHR